MASKLIVGYDAVAMSVGGWHEVVPVKNPTVLGCYGNGLYANHTVAREAFPKATIFTYDVHATMPECDALDIEPGNAFPSEAPAWSKAWLKIAGHVLPRPTHYQSASTTSLVVSEMLDSGFKRSDFNIHSAHYGHGEHICGPATCGYAQADGTQWADKGPAGQNVDQNIFAAYFFKGVAPTPELHYDWFDTRKRLMFAGRTEQEVVQEYDKWRATQSKTSHPHRVRLAYLRGQLFAGSVRLSKMTELDKQHKFHRFWRKRELLERAKGRRFV